MATIEVSPDIRLFESREEQRTVPQHGTFAEEVVITSLSQAWVEGFPDLWFGIHPFDVTVVEAPKPADLNAIHDHFEHCPGLLRVGPVVTVLKSVSLTSSTFHLENAFRSAVQERNRAPVKLIVADQEGLDFDFFPYSLPQLNRAGVPFGEDAQVPRWEIQPDHLENLGPAISCTLGAWQAVLFPSNLVIARVRRREPYMLAYGYFRGLHPATQ